MASEYFSTGVVLNSTTYEGFFEYYISEITPSTVTVYARSVCRNNGKNYGRWCGANVWIDSSGWVGPDAQIYQGSIEDYGMHDRVSKSGSAIFSRTTQDRQIAVQAWYAADDGKTGGSARKNWGGTQQYSPTRYITIPALDPPAAPSSLSVSNNSANNLVLSWVDNATYETAVMVERSASGTGGWAEIAVLGANVTTFTDTAAVAGATNFYRVRAYTGGIGYSGYSNTASAIRYATPAAPSAVTVTRETDNRNTVSWTRNATTVAPYTTLVLQRSTDGGAWSNLASAISGVATSYADTSTQPNHSYAYRIQAVNIAGSSAFSTGATVYNTPAAPGKPSLSRTSTNQVTATFSNPGITETGIEYQRSTDGSAWSASVAVAGADKTSFPDTPGGGTWYYRVRNTRGALVSAWSPTSDAVVTIVAPAAPTLTSPASGTVVSKTQGTVTFGWTHNPIDGSAQSAAQLHWSTDNWATMTTVEITGIAQTYDVPNDFAVNSTVVWHLRTKGAHADWGPWSSDRTFRVYQIPQASITSPSADDPITDVPITISWDYADESGTQTGAQIVIIDSSGGVPFSRNLTGAATEILVPSSEFLPANNSTYTVQLSVASSSSLTSLTSSTFSTDYTPPADPRIDMEIDRGSYSVSLTVFEGVGGEGIPLTDSLGLFRTNPDGTKVWLAEGVVDGNSALDVFPPLDVDIVYTVIASTVNGLTALVEYTVRLDSDGIVVFNFGDDYRNVCKMVLDPEYSSGRVHDVELVKIPGRRLPLAFYGEALSSSGVYSGVVPRRPEVAPERCSLLSAVEELSKYIGRVVMRRPYEATLVVDLSVDLARHAARDFVAVSVSWTEVEPDGLDT